jgi:hypothetical protein
LEIKFATRRNLKSRSLKIGTCQQKLEKLKPENGSVKMETCQQKLENWNLKSRSVKIGT